MYIQLINFLLWSCMSSIYAIDLPGDPEKCSIIAPGDTTVYTYVESMPEYKDGATEWLKYVRRNLRLSAEEEFEDGVPGKIIGKFIVEKDGSFSHIRILKVRSEVAPEQFNSLERSFYELLENAPCWKPGIQGGDTVRVEYTLPVYVHY